MNEEENTIQTNNSSNIREGVQQDEHGQSLEDKIEAMLKLNWVMLPESCSIPCNIYIDINSLQLPFDGKSEWTEILSWM